MPLLIGVAKIDIAKDESYNLSFFKYKNNNKVNYVDMNQMHACGPHIMSLLKTYPSSKLQHQILYFFIKFKIILILFIPSI